MLARGEPLMAVLQSLLGTDSAGRAALGTWLSFLATLATLDTRRRVVEHFLRTFEHCERHGSMWRVVDRRAFVGRQHEDVDDELARESIDPESGEVLHRVHRHYPRDEQRRHCPAARAGGLAAHSGRSPRTLNRYRASLRGAQIMGSAQPPAEAPDAVRPRRSDGTWAYAQHWLVLPPTPAMLERWRGRTAASPLRPPTPLPRRYSAVQPPRSADLGALSQLVERA